MPNNDGLWIQTYTGGRFDLLFRESYEQVDIRDIAHSLSNLCRFNGHTYEFYSVAQHSVLVAAQCPRLLAIYGLLHDAHEAYIGDMTRPLKRLFPEFSRIARMVQHRILTGLGVRIGRIGVNEKLIDDRVLVTERRDLLLESPCKWLPALELLEPYPTKIVPWTPDKAEYEFLRMYGYYMGVLPAKYKIGVTSND